MPIPETHFFSHLTPCTRRVQSQLPPALRTTDPERQRLATTRCPTDQMRISLSNCCGGNRLKVPTFSGSELFPPHLDRFHTQKTTFEWGPFVPDAFSVAFRGTVSCTCEPGRCMTSQSSRPVMAGVAPI